jgi:hypothetical protein
MPKTPKTPNLKKESNEDSSTKEIILKVLKDKYFELLKQEKGFSSDLTKQIDMLELEIKKRTAELGS